MPYTRWSVLRTTCKLRHWKLLDGEMRESFRPRERSLVRDNKKCLTSRDGCISLGILTVMPSIERSESEDGFEYIDTLLLQEYILWWRPHSKCESECIYWYHQNDGVFYNFERRGRVKPHCYYMANRYCTCCYRENACFSGGKYAHSACIYLQTVREWREGLRIKVSADIKHCSASTLD